MQNWRERSEQKNRTFVLFWSQDFNFYQKIQIFSSITFSFNYSDAEIETNQLRETLADHQGAIVIAKKKEKKLIELQNLIAKYDENIDQAMNERMEEATKKIKADADERVRVMEEEKNSAIQRLSDIESKIELDRRQLEVTKSEVFDANQKATEEIDAKSAEGKTYKN